MSKGYYKLRPLAAGIFGLAIGYGFMLLIFGPSTLRGAAATTIGLISGWLLRSWVQKQNETAQLDVDVKDMPLASTASPPNPTP